MAHRTTPNTCKVCGQIFLARILDLERGAGGTCSPRCAGRVRGQKSSLAQASHLPRDGKPTQKEIVLDLLKRHGKVTMRQFFQSGVGYTFRNRVSELRRDGYKIDCQLGKRPSENVYVLLATPEPIQAAAVGL